MKNQSCNMLLP